MYRRACSDIFHEFIAICSIIIDLHSIMQLFRQLGRSFHIFPNALLFVFSSVLFGRFFPLFVSILFTLLWAGKFAWKFAILVSMSFPSVLNTKPEKMAKICRKFYSRLSTLTQTGQVCSRHMCELVVFRRRFQLARWTFVFSLSVSKYFASFSMRKLNSVASVVRLSMANGICHASIKESRFEKKQVVHSCVRQEHELEASWAKRKRGPLFSLLLFILWSSEMKIY